MKKITRSFGGYMSVKRNDAVRQNQATIDRIRHIVEVSLEATAPSPTEKALDAARARARGLNISKAPPRTLEHHIVKPMGITFEDYVMHTPDIRTPYLGNSYTVKSYNRAAPTATPRRGKVRRVRGESLRRIFRRTLDENDR